MCGYSLSSSCAGLAMIFAEIASSTVDLTQSRPLRIPSAGVRSDNDEWARPL